MWSIQAKESPKGEEEVKATVAGMVAVVGAEVSVVTVVVERELAIVVEILATWCDTAPSPFQNDLILYVVFGRYFIAKLY